MLLHNGNITPTWHTDGENRSFRYGDGFFESLVVYKGELQLFDLHYERLQKALKILQLQAHDGLEKEVLSRQLDELVAASGHTQGRIRLIVWRNDGGLYLPQQNSSSYLAEISELKQPPYLLNDAGIKLCLYSDLKKSADLLAGIKTTSSLLYVLASKHAAAQGCDEAVLLNHNGNVIESSSSNIFVVKGNKISTPPLSEGCLDGIMRRRLLQLLPQTDYAFSETPLTIADLETAGEIFITKASGIKWVSTIKGHYNSLTNEVAKTLSQLLP